MNNRSHNKKRNTGLLYEFLVGVISRALVDGNKKSSQQALKILKRHFKPGSELYKEFRLIHALRKTTVSSEQVAGNILQEAKLAARSHDLKELDRQKSLLIRDINHCINDENFYDQQVSEYRLLATVQTLLNDWRDRDVDLGRVASYEDQLIKHLTTEKTILPDQQLNEETPGESRLLMKVMMKKLNEKYSEILNDEQKALIRAYAFSTANDDSGSIKMKLEEVKNSLISMIDNFNVTHPENVYIINKLNETRDRLLVEKLDVIDDETVTRFMLYTKLATEIESKETSDDR
jgi:hypothetical protein